MIAELREIFSKPVLETISLSAHFAATLIFAWRYLRSRHRFFLWVTLWVAALFWRDWHVLEHVVSKTLDSFSYYAVLLAAFGSGFFWKKEIVETLKQNRRLVVVWGTVFVLYAVAVTCDKRILTFIFQDHGLKSFENFLEESAEALGALLLCSTGFFKLEGEEK